MFWGPIDFLPPFPHFLWGMGELTFLMCVPSGGGSIPIAVGPRGSLGPEGRSLPAPLVVLSPASLWVHDPLFENKVTMDVVYIVVFWVLVGVRS